MSAISVMRYIQNKPDISLNERFAAIIGLSPSKGARSPALWNAVFEKSGTGARMYPLDVLESDLDATMAALCAETRYLGGAVAMPHKESIARWLGRERLSEEANRIGAVNCIFRKPNGDLCGTNTDGEAALACFVDSYGSVVGKAVFLLGCGGAGKAVAAYFSAAGARVTLGVRDVAKVSGFAASISATAVAWDDFERVAGVQDVIVNTTDIGFAGSGKGNQTPLLAEQVELLKPDARVYDIIYDPAPTVLLAAAARRGLATMGGGCMNLEQAVLGFGYCMPGTGDRDEVRKIMLAEKKSRGW